MIKKTIIAGLCLAAFISGCSQNNSYAPESIVWNEISEDESASFPFGNGEVAGNVWAEKNGMYVYLTRNDCFSELGRLLKTGKIKLSVDSCSWDEGCKQKLDLENGMVEITNSKMSVKVFADSKLPIIWIHGKLQNPSNVSIEPVIWRDSPHIISGDKPTNVWDGDEIMSAWTFRSFKGDLPYPESADVTFSLDNCIGFFHHNDTSGYEFTLKNNHLNNIGVKDPIKDRTFGAMLKSDNMTKTEGGILKSEKPISEFTIKVAVTSFPSCSPENWKQQTLSVLESSDTFDQAEDRTKSYWNDKWSKSYLKISTPDTVTGKKITELYNCQRWMTLCAGKSSYPIKFNGSIFTLSPYKINGIKDLTPDFRMWGDAYWWQNTRLPYYPMLKTGDWETIRHLAEFYHSLMPAFREQAKVYYGIDGAILPETITQYGTFAPCDYGLGADSTGPINMNIRHIFQDPLEFIHLMMDCYRYSGNEEFLKKEIVPMSEDFLDFFISYAKIDSLGKMRMKNTQSLETYWFGVENDMPTVAGLHAVVKDFTTLPSDTLIPTELAKKIEYIKKALPDIPTEKGSEGNLRFAPAEKYDSREGNSENPALMVVFPFEVCNFTSPDVEVGRQAFRDRKFKNHFGWARDCQEAAILGMTEEAKDELLIRIENKNAAFKFPTYFGPNFDWVPDQDHGGNLMTSIQDLVIQSYDGKVYLLPAFPKDWDVQFRFAVPGEASVWGNYKGGKWVDKPKSDKATTEIVYK